MGAKLLTLLLVCSFIGEAFATDEDGSFTIYLVRHAEKVPDGSRDPELTKIGMQRSARLADWFGDKNIEDVWSSDYKRTRDTATPILAKLETDLVLYDPRNLPEITEKLLALQHTALVIGHSNTTPQLARLLCNCEIADMDETEHDRLIMISIHDDKTRVKTLRQK